MSTRTIPASRAIDWFKQGWNIFLSNWAIWVLLILVLGVFAFVMNIFLIVGQIALTVLTPALVGGLLYAAKQAKANAPVKFDYLWLPLQDAKKRKELLLMGVLFFTAVLMVGILSAIFVGQSVMVGEGILSTGVGGLIFLLIVSFVLFVYVNYATALIVFQDMLMVDAVKKCTAVVWKQIAPLGVLFLIYAVLSMIAMIPLWLGMLVLLPVVSIAIYLSYEELFSA